MTRRLIVVGAGGHGRVVADTARSAGFELIAFADDRATASNELGLPIVPAAPESLAKTAAQSGAEVVVAIGDNRLRKQLQEALLALGVPLASVVHPSAVVSSHSRLGAGCMLLAHSHLGIGSELAAGVIVNHGASIDHDGKLGPFVHLSPGVHLGGQVAIGEGAHLAVGVSVRNRVSIGAWSVIGVGAAVVADIPDNVVAFGVPARIRASSRLEEK